MDAEQGALDWKRLQESLNRLEVKQIERRLAVSPVLFTGGSAAAEPILSLDCSQPEDAAPGKIPDPSEPVPWPSPTGPTNPDPPLL